MIPILKGYIDIRSAVHAYVEAAGGWKPELSVRVRLKNAEADMMGVPRGKPMQEVRPIGGQA